VKRRRLKHTAHVLCEMFHGWRNSWEKVASLGDGTLNINALTADCTFDGKSIETLPIARELHYWLQDDLKAQGIPLDAIRSAWLEVQLSHTGIVHEMVCRSEIATDERTYLWPRDQWGERISFWQAGNSTVRPDS
jgi:hypothetical protein